MSSAATSIRNRESGRRNDGKQRARQSTPGFLGVSNHSSNGLNVGQIYEIERLYNSHPAVTAARTVLHAQLFSGGIALYRDGKAQSVIKESKRPAVASSSSSSVPTRAPSEAGDESASTTGVKEAFAKHLSNHWMSFAKDVCDSFLKWGLCVVVFELETEDLVKRAVRLAKAEEKMSGPESSRKRGEPDVSKRLIPKVPALGTYDVGFDYVGRFGYTREFKVYSQLPGKTHQEDDQSVVFIRQEPDTSGNVNSPLASVYELGSFVHSLTELAMVAEISRATPQIVTQLRPPQKSTGLDAGALFFDQESRDVQSGQSTEESQSAAHALEMQAKLCSIINKLQTSYHPDAGKGGAGGSGKQPAFTPHDIQPKLFCIPKDQELAPSNKPEARSDLESLQRLAIEQVAASLGVPASLIFEGKYVGKSSQQLQLLNSTVSQLAKSINDVLTKTYLALYPDEESNPLTGKRQEKADTNLELKLRTAPLSASEEIVALYNAKLIDSDTAVPAVLHSLGATSDEIDAALERVRAKEEKECACDDERRDLETESKKIALETARANLKNAKGTREEGGSSSSAAAAAEEEKSN